MESAKNITIETTVHAPIEKVWEYWTAPNHIKKWNNTSDDWYTPFAENDLKVGGKFVSRMEAKDGSSGFDFGGIYDEIELYQVIAYTMDDGRKVKIKFSVQENDTKIMETFDADTTEPIELQQQGWQAILNNFKKYVEQGN